ncbi:MAG: GDP-4-dehydro-6-deoxy-D-mannose reductase [Gaiellales bacterium]|nr:GDP-4-dehydro-6-deoxy-D-mannose reductase [Gaiellales bacterium]
MQRVLITGADGFAGRHLRSALESRGSEAIASSSDVRDAAAVAQEVRAIRPDAIAHLASISSVADTIDREREVWEVNGLGTLNVVLAAAEHAPEARLLVTSSSEVYGRIGEDEGPVDESRPLAPVSPYGRSKAAAEFACARDDIDVVVVRPFPHTGPGQTETFAIASFAGQIARIEAGIAPPSIKVGNLAARRDYSDVRCVVDAYVRVLEMRGGPRVLNVATGTAHAMSSILERLLALAGVEIAVEVDPSRMRPADIPLLVGSPRRLGEATGWRPKRSLDETLADVLDAAREGAGTE